MDNSIDRHGPARLGELYFSVIALTLIACFVVFPIFAEEGYWDSAMQALTGVGVYIIAIASVVYVVWVLVRQRNKQDSSEENALSEIS